MAEKKKHFPLPVRRNTAFSEAAYARLRALNAAYGFGNNYCLTFLLENLDELVDGQALDALYKRYADEYGAPAKGGM